MPILLAACAHDTLETNAQDVSWGTFPTPGATTKDTPIGLALEINDGTPVPLRVRKNQRFYINQIDLRAHIDATTDEGVAGLDQHGDFADLDWRRTAFADESFVPTPNPDGTFTRRRMYREARWMDLPSVFVIEQLGADGRVSGSPIVVDTGHEYLRTNVDSFFTRRLRAIQWTNDCAATDDCSSAHNFMEEALVELRYSNGPNPSFQFDSATTQLRVSWTANNDHGYTIPVQQIANPEWDYGFGIDLAVTTPPQANGTYAPGQVLDVKFTLRDGAGKALHDPGVLPTFLDYLAGNTPSGINYWNVTEKVMTYYRRKHKEKQMLIAIDGPVQNTGAIHEEVDFFTGIFTSADGAVVTAKPAEQGFYGEAASVPAWATLIGLTPPDAPVGDTVQLTLPLDAQPGTYKIVMKARRSYLGEEIPRAKVIEIQVGTTQHTTKQFNTGNCETCHSNGSDLSRISHGIELADRDTCTTCHAPLGFEPEGPVYVRTHFIHSRTKRLGAPLVACNSCHLNAPSVQRTSKSACLSCHTSYPQSHVEQYGPIVDMYIGGTIDDSFQQCTTTCHTTHPRSGL
ncbi:MAG: cytochrome c3 family protein [Deltaproteobacteria bacterium]|nr:cytochrome c3 family protein [Deltaproteobacteria bacterium]